MAELTSLESKVGEVLGLAMAAQTVTDKVKGLVEEEDESVAQVVQRMHHDAAQLEERATAFAGELDGKKTAILEKARETKQEATEMMSTYLGSDADGLDGLEFLTMAEAAEVGHWSIVAKMNERAQVPGLQELVDFALPIERGHFEQALESSLELAAQEDPSEPA